MAVTSGSFDTTHRISGNYNTYGHLEWSVSATGDNYSDITFTFSGRTANSYQYVYVYSASVTIDGHVYSSWAGNMYNGTTMITNTYRFYHTAEATLSISAGLSMVSSTSWYDGADSWTIPAVGPTPPTFTPKLYGPVNGRARPIKKLYASVGGQAKKVKKLYASVGGEAKLIYEDNS